MRLYSKVSEAIVLAERLEEKDPTSPETKAAFKEVCRLELNVLQAKHLPAVERNISRRSAIIAALKAGEPEYAKQLLVSFEDSPEFDKATNKELRTLVAGLTVVA